MCYIYTNLKNGLYMIINIFRKKNVTTHANNYCCVSVFLINKKKIIYLIKLLYTENINKFTKELNISLMKLHFIYFIVLLVVSTYAKVDLCTVPLDRLSPKVIIHHYSYCDIYDKTQCASKSLHIQETRIVASAFYI